MTGTPFGRTVAEIMVQFGELKSVDKEMGGKFAVCVFVFLAIIVRAAQLFGG